MSPAARDYTLVIGSSVFFHVPNDNNLYMRLPGGAEAWAGYRQAVKPCQYGLSFNIDLAATAFLTSGELVNVLSSVLELRDLRAPLNPRQLRQIKETVRGMRVRQEIHTWCAAFMLPLPFVCVVLRADPAIEYLQTCLQGFILDAVQVSYRCPSGTIRNKLIRELGTQPIDRTMFTLDNGQQVSVAQYYATTYQKRLNYPNLPPVNVSSQSGRKVWIPMELCR